jgi:hypothetical protein
MPPGTNEPPSLAGALPLATGTRLSGLGPHPNHGVLRDLLPLLDTGEPAPGVTRLDGVVEHAWRQKATAVEQGWASPPRLACLG